MKNLVKFDKLLKSDTLGVAILNVKNLTNFFFKTNDKFKEFLQYDEDTLNQLILTDKEYSNIMTEIMEDANEIIKGKESYITYPKEYTRKDLSKFWALVSITRISDSFLLYIIQDNSTIRKMEKDINELIEPLSEEEVNEYCLKIKKQTIKEGYSEKDRRYFRVDFGIPVCAKMYLFQNIKGSIMGFSPNNVCIYNISGNGLCFYTSYELPKYEEFKMVFKFSLLGVKLRLIGEVVRVRRVKNKIEYGVKFEINETETDKLIGVLNEVSIMKRNGMTFYDTDLCTSCKCNAKLK
ncbi:PilZ domain-containing protein [Clostridiaceae bacterium M8S5]|nr:PilZ domain-containing protein [Clostridiaceae bacterium M8S5]